MTYLNFSVARRKKKHIIKCVISDINNKQKRTECSVFNINDRIMRRREMKIEKEKEKVVIDSAYSQDGYEQSYLRSKRQKTLLSKFKIRFIFADNPHDSYKEYEIEAMNKSNALFKALTKLNDDSLPLDEVNSIILRSSI